MNRQESAVCQATEKYIFPKRAKSTEGKWRYIVNTGKYKQGVTIETCHPRRTRGTYVRTPTKQYRLPFTSTVILLPLFSGESCKYDGEEGQFPQATECKQIYTKHNMLAISEDGDIFVENFRIPSTCVCSIVDESEFFRRK